MAKQEAARGGICEQLPTTRGKQLKTTVCSRFWPMFSRLRGAKKHRGGGVWWKRAAHLMTARKQTGRHNLLAFRYGEICLSYPGTRREDGCRNCRTAHLGSLLWAAGASAHPFLLGGSWTATGRSCDARGLENGS